MHQVPPSPPEGELSVETLQHVQKLLVKLLGQVERSTAMVEQLLEIRTDERANLTVVNGKNDA